MKTRIKPLKGLIVRDPIGKSIVPEEGVDVRLNSYWKRRLNDGSMVIVNNAPEKKKEDEGTSLFKRSNK